MRGGGTSQSGQTVNSGLILDTSKRLNRLLHLDVEARRAVVEPGIVLDELNRRLKPHGLWFPVDVSTASRATIGGMAANNSCGSRSLRYGTMRDNTIAIDAILADGSKARFASARPESAKRGPAGDLVAKLLDLGRREAAGDRRQVPEGAAPCRRLQSRRPAPGQGGRQPGSSSRRIGGHARPFDGRSRSGSGRCRRRGRCSASATSRPSARQWRRPATSSPSNPPPSN